MTAFAGGLPAACRWLGAAGCGLLLFSFGDVGLADVVRVLGLPAVQVGDPAKAELGRSLFVDRRLSADGGMSCATCHVPEQAFTQTGRRTSAGRDGEALRRNAPSLLNVGFATPLMHDGAAPSLEAQVLTPLLDRREMANAAFADLEQRLASIPEYTQTFQDLFGAGPSMARIGEALAAYERTLVSGNSAFDRWKFGGDESALSETAKQGFALFSGKAGCVSCHAIDTASALFTDNRMHNTGVGAKAMVNAEAGVVRHVDSGTVDFGDVGDRGRHEITGDRGDLYRYRTATLRNVAVTGPYMHDGSLATLEDVVRFYNAGGFANSNLDPVIKPLGLNDQEIVALVAFLDSLTGDNVAKLAAEARRAAAPAQP